MTDYGAQKMGLCNDIFSGLITVEPLHNGHLGDRRKWPLWGGRGII